MKNWIKRILWMMGTGLSLMSVQAQQTLSLEEAIRIGLQKNFQVLMVRDEVAIARNNNTWGEAGRYPSVNLQILQNNTLNDQTNNPTSFIRDRIFTNGITGNAELNWMLFGGFRVNITKQMLALLQAQSEGNAMLVIENTVQSIVLAYYSALLQREKLDVLRDLTALSKDKYQLFETRKELGSVSMFDVLQMKNAFLSDSANYLLQELAYRNAVRNLNLLMAEEVTKDYFFTDFLEPLTERYNLDSLQAKALKSNTNILNQYINLELQRNEVGLQQSFMYPVVSFALGASQAFSQIHFQRADDTRYGSNLTYYGNFTISFNLFNGGRTRRAIQNARIQQKIAETGYSEQVFVVKNQLVHVYELYTARMAILQLTHEAYLSAEYNMKLAQERFERGSINAFNFRDVQLAFLNSAMMRLEAAYELMSAHTELIRLTGGLLQLEEPSAGGTE